MKRLAVVFVSICVGCSAPVFTDLGNGVAVPVEAIDEYAQEHGVTRAEARARLKAEFDARRIQEHADTYGISKDEARRQLNKSTQ